MCCCTFPDFLLMLLAFIFPPAAVVIRSGIASSDLVLNMLLTMCGFVPGCIHAIYYISMTSPLRNDDYSTRYQQGWIDSERLVSSNSDTRPVPLATHDPTPQVESSQGETPQATNDEVSRGYDVQTPLLNDPGYIVDNKKGGMPPPYSPWTVLTNSWPLKFPIKVQFFILLFLYIFI